MVLQKWLTKNVNKTVESVVEPAKKMIRDKAAQAGNQTDLATKLLLLGASIFLVWTTFGKSDSNESASPRNDDTTKYSHIVINNYISHTKEDDDDDD